ncbi:sensor histidine kinase [Micromonospora mangrovi]|uniref:histidine kinase n=2 Tax=Micromonospora TaxID=1873 RepID=A0AAU7MEE2_9ACTN
MRTPDGRLAADVALGAAFAGTLAVQSAAIAASWGGTYWWFGGAVGAVVCLLALARRRHRGWTAVAGLAVAGAAVPVAEVAGLPHEPGPAAALGLAVLVGAAVGRLPVRWAGAVALGGLAVVVGAGLSAGLTAVTELNATTWLAAVTAGGARRTLDARRRATTDRVRRDERLELARELHDVVAHHVTGIVVQAQGAGLVADRRPEQVRQSLAGIEAAGSDALTAMRRVVGLLRDTDDAAPVPVGGEELATLVARFHRPGVTVRLSAPGRTASWPPEVSGTVHRVVREALTNVARHAPHATAVDVVVAERAGTVTVEVRDDAPPAPARHPRRAGYGLVGMRERVETLGGTLSAGPGPDGGWSVLASVPCGERR